MTSVLVPLYVVRKRLDTQGIDGTNGSPAIEDDVCGSCDKIFDMFLDIEALVTAHTGASILTNSG
jgi:hypothetical protein